MPTNAKKIRIGGVSHDIEDTQARTDISDLKSSIDKDASVDINTYIKTGVALADGTFGSRSDFRYIIKQCTGIKEITVTTGLWSATFPIVVFYGASGTVVSYISPSTTGVQTATIAVPSAAAQYAVNCANSSISDLAVTEYFSLWSAIDSKQDSLIEVLISGSDELKPGKIGADGVVYPGLTNTAYIMRSAVGVEKIAVNSGYWSTPKVVFLAADGSVLSTVDGTSGQNVTTATVPSGATMYAANCANEATYINSFSVNETWEVAEKLKEIYTAMVSSSPQYASLLLPEWYPQVVDVPSYLFFEPMVLKGLAKDYVVTAETHTNTDYIFFDRENAYFDVPTTSGNTNLDIKLYDKNKLVEVKELQLRTVPKTAQGSAKVLIIGDSKSVASTAWEKLSSMLSLDSNISLTFLGRLTNGGVSREAYSGKSIVNFCDDQYITGTTQNIFYDASVTTTNGHHFSFAKAVTALGDTPDIVIIDLGANQWSTTWETIKGCYDDVISSIHSVSSNIKIVIVLQEGSALSETPTLKNNGKWWSYNVFGASENKMMSEYVGRESENIFIQPQYLTIDLHKDFPICEIPSFDGSSGEQPLCMDIIHPGLNADAWNSSTSYKYGDWVAKNGKGFGCKKANTNVDPETDDGTYWAECKNLGDGYRKKGLMYYCMLKYLMTV